MIEPAQEQAAMLLRAAGNDLMHVTHESAAAATSLEPYTAMTTLARELVQLAKSSAGSEFGRFFELVEDLLAGTPATRNLVIVGLLEDLQNASLHSDLSLTYWDRFLGSRTRDAWKAVIDVWASRIAPSEFNRFVDGGWSLKRRS